MRFHNITTDDMLNGEGLRTVLWLAGCNHNCPGCQNPITHDPEGGLPFDEEAFGELIGYLSKPWISGLTFSGGEATYPTNRKPCAHIARNIKLLFPNKTIWVYSGYRFEEIKDIELMKYTDVLCDGPFVQKLLDVNTPYVGSTNQRIIDVQKSLKKGEVVLYESR